MANTIMSILEMQSHFEAARRELYYKTSDQVDIPGLQSKEEGFESPGGRQPIWTESDAHNRELEARIDAKRKIISLLQDEISELEERKTP